MTDKKEIKKYCSGIDCLTCGEAEPCIYRIANKLQEQLNRKEQELKNICKAFDIEYAIDEETGNLIGRCNKLYKKEQECEELKKILNEGCLHNLTLMTEQRVLLQNLTEIKEIAGKQCNICEALTPIDEYKDCKKCWQGVILQKISEVGNE